MSIYCRKCKKVLPDLSGAAFCPFCGAKQTADTKRRRRANGEGSVFKRPNGSYRIQLTEYKNGKRITKTKTGFKTRADAYAYIPILRGEDKSPPALTFKQAFDGFISTHDRSRATLNCYRAGVKAFAPLYDTPITDITIEDLQNCLDDITAGKRTKQNAKAAAGLIYKYAIPRCPALRQLNLGSYLKIYDDGDSAPRPAFTAEELERIRQAIGKHEAAAIVYCHCYLGFRPSALLALTCDDFHPEQGGYFVGGIKTDAGRDRVVPVPAKIRPYFDPGRAFIFSLGDGSQKLTAERYRALFYDLMEYCGIDNPIINGLHLYSPHSCRHTYATLLKQVTAPDVDKMALIGHASPEQLRDYMSVNLHELRRIVDALP